MLLKTDTQRDSLNIHDLRKSSAKFLQRSPRRTAKAQWPWDPKEKGFKQYKELIDSTIVVLIAMLMLGGFIAFTSTYAHQRRQLPDEIRNRWQSRPDQWYVVHVLSGQEQKVHDNLLSASSRGDGRLRL